MLQETSQKAFWRNPQDGIGRGGRYGFWQCDDVRASLSERIFCGFSSCRSRRCGRGSDDYRRFSHDIMEPIAAGPTIAAPTHQATCTPTNNTPPSITLLPPLMGSQGTDNIEKKNTPDNKMRNTPNLPITDGGSLRTSPPGSASLRSFDILDRLIMVLVVRDHCILQMRDKDFLLLKREFL